MGPAPSGLQEVDDSTIYFEVLVLVYVLVSDVFCNHIICHVAGTAAEVAARPQVASPELFLQVRKLGQQMVRRAPFQPLHQSADRPPARQRDQQVHVFFRHMPFHDRYLMLAANVPDQIANPRRHLALQRGPSILRDPHQMKVDFKYSVRASPVFRHPRSLSARTR